MLPYASRAGLPLVKVEQQGEARVFEVYVPGVKVTDTEVIWDEQQQTLLVGVWRGRRPSRLAGAPRRRPELIWFQRFYLPGADGHLARAEVSHGMIRVQVPVAAERRASWEPPDASIGPSEVAARHPGLLDPELRQAA
jgi:HSP20 family molecular chaperone IbpA